MTDCVSRQTVFTRRYASLVSDWKNKIYSRGSELDSSCSEFAGHLALFLHKTSENAVRNLLDQMIHIEFSLNNTADIQEETEAMNQKEMKGKIDLNIAGVN